MSNLIKVYDKEGTMFELSQANATDAIKHLGWSTSEPQKKSSKKSAVVEATVVEAPVVEDTVAEAPVVEATVVEDEDEATFAFEDKEEKPVEGEVAPRKRGRPAKL